MIETGRPEPLGASWDGEGVNFALFSGSAESVTLCFFDADKRHAACFELAGKTGDIWHGYVPACTPGQAYGYRIHGRYEPEEGLRHNASKLLIDPYARKLRGELTWSPALYDFQTDGRDAGMRLNDADSADFVPKGVVVGGASMPANKNPVVPWTDMIIYEANVRGYTMRHPAVTETDRGLFRGMKNGQILEYLKSLGITSVELMPVHAFVDEHFLWQRGLRNFWGYNPISFFAPAQRYLGGDDIVAFREMVDAIHDAGIEVILDVVFNHTGESDRFGPSLSFRGIDNLCYYRTIPDKPGEYINDTGCGNTINVDHPVVRGLIMDSLRYWAQEMRVDGFRFDLATVLGRGPGGFDRDHEMLRSIGADAVLENVKLIAEPWDPGPGGYHLASFPPRWAEWNDHFRDVARRFWRGDPDQVDEYVQRMCGSPDLFRAASRKPAASVNFVTSHDGFTLADLVSYDKRHNEANGEENRDGHEHNYSCNYGTEGESGDPDIEVVRRRQRLNLLATLLLSRGTPMLLAGDEIGNSQGGNNNAYAQDNDIGWLDWSGVDRDPDFPEAVRALIRIRKELQPLQQAEYIDGWSYCGKECCAIVWNGGGENASGPAIAILCNAATEAVDLVLPDQMHEDGWQVVFTTGEFAPQQSANGSWRIAGRSIACLQQESRA